MSRRRSKYRTLTR